VAESIKQRPPKCSSAPSLVLFDIDSEEIESMIELRSENRQTQFPFESRLQKLIKSEAWPPTKTELPARSAVFLDELSECKTGFSVMCKQIEPAALAQFRVVVVKFTNPPVHSARPKPPESEARQLRPADRKMSAERHRNQMAPPDCAAH
jgi:hypothetical protein